MMIVVGREDRDRVIRIVGVQKNAVAEQEFVLLQNQGSMRISLRGHVVLSDCAVETGDLGMTAHAFKDDVPVPPGMYVILFSGHGTSRWAKTKDGAQVYYTYMGRDACVWERSTGPLHVLNRIHTYAERRQAQLVS
jgi:hypothetical protein